MKYYLFIILSLLPSGVFSYDIIWEKTMSVRKFHCSDPNHIQTIPAKINLNTSDKETLMKLSGIGPKKAENIIAYRLQHGAFQSIRDLSKVRGISKKILEKILEKNKHILTISD